MDYFTADIFTCQTLITLTTGSAKAIPQYCACWPTGMDYWHTYPSFILLVTRVLFPEM